MIDEIHQSMISMFLRCGLQFEKRYLENLKIPPGVAARRGSSFHKAAEVNHKQKMETKADLPLGDLKDAGRDEFVRLVKEEGVFIPTDKLTDKNALLNEALNESLSAIELYHRDIAPGIEPAAVEKALVANIGCALPIGGKLDLIEPTRIRDFKCGKTKNQTWADRAIQPTFYHALYKSEYGAYPEEFRYDIISPLKTKTNHIALPTHRDDTDIVNVRLTINEFIKALKAGDFHQADPDHWICSEDWCGFWWICSRGALKRTIH